jgi:SAM-dependent methyltransferase
MSRGFGGRRDDAGWNKGNCNVTWTSQGKTWPTTPLKRAAPGRYTPEYYDAILEGSKASAAVIVPLVQDIVGARSVVDVGCGTGAWLAEFARCGANRVLGLDGEYVDRSRLLIPRERFVATDLDSNWNTPAGEGVFDLAVCLEVGEHLKPERSERLIAMLTSLAPVVAFGAAIPYQGGEEHVNERWPTFWQELFAARAYEVVDPIRKRVWSDRRVEPWYQQNFVLYASREAIAQNQALRLEHENTFPGFLSIVHPRLYGPLLERSGVKPTGPWVPEGERVSGIRTSARNHGE